MWSSHYTHVPPFWKAIHLLLTTLVQDLKRTASKIFTSVATRTGNISTSNKNSQFGNRTKGGWYAARQFVVVEAQVVEFGQESRFGWKGTRELVAGKIQRRQLGQNTNFGWKRTSQFIVVEIQKSDFGQQNNWDWRTGSRNHEIQTIGWRRSFNTLADPPKEPIGLLESD